MARLSEDVLIKIIENCDGQTVFEGTRTASSTLHALSVKYGPKIELALKIDDRQRISVLPRHAQSFSADRRKKFGCMLSPAGIELKDLTLTEAEKELSDIPHFFVITELSLTLKRRDQDGELTAEDLCHFARTNKRLFQIKILCVEKGDLQDDKQLSELDALVRTFGLHGLVVDFKLNLSNSVTTFTRLYQGYNLQAKTLRLRLSSQDELDEVLSFLLSCAQGRLCHNAAVFLKVQNEISTRDLFDRGNAFAKALATKQLAGLQFLSIKAIEPELAEFVELDKQFHRFKKSQFVGYSVDYSYGVNVQLAQAFNTAKVSFDDKLGLDSGVQFECKITAQKPVLLRLIMLGVIDTIMGTQCRLRAGETKTFVAKPRKRGDDEPEIGYCIPMALITFVELRDDSDIEEEWINLYSGVEMPETKIEECPFSIEASALSSQ